MPSSAPQSMFNLLQGSAYDRENIYAHSTDGKGHYERMRVKVTPAIEAEIAALVASKTRPGYRTTEDFVRNAIVHQLHFEATNVWPQGQPIVTTEMMHSVINRQKAQVEQWEQVVKELMALGEKLLATGALGELETMLNTYDREFFNWDIPDNMIDATQDSLNSLRDKMTREYQRRSVQ